MMPDAARIRALFEREQIEGLGSDPVAGLATVFGGGGWLLARTGTLGMVDRV